MIQWTIIILNGLFLSFILVYSLVQLLLTIKYLRKRNNIFNESVPLENFPHVTVQLPIYNEKYVIERLIKAITKFNYPKDKLEIQVLDDSTDETVALVKNCIEKYQQEGFHIRQVVRQDRVDYKAGALKYGLEQCKGEFVAIFDADFIPSPDFLTKTLPFFADEKVGVVQTRWGHLNESFSILTQLQAYALNAHFTIEQTGRNIAGHFINFNGTAGIWRKKTIEDAGGWEGDTLTEDLDLSYRAQLKGWKFQYLEDVISPAELPAEMNALRSQQFRWAKGAAECTRKNLSKVFRSASQTVATKVHAFFHLLNSFVWVCLLGSALLLMPFQYVVNVNPGLKNYLGIFVIFEVSFFLLLIFYFTANVVANKAAPFWKNLMLIPLYPFFLTFSMGISIYNTIGVLEGYLGKKSPFVRTPKFNITSKQDGFQKKSYVKFKLSPVSMLELCLFCYFAFSSFMTWQYGNYKAFMFLLMMTCGIALVFILSVLHHLKANQRS
ncbi:MAG: cellulose synthase family protein [Bacteroidota bacterium]